MRDIVNTVAITAIQAQPRHHGGRALTAYVLVVNAGSSSLKYSLVDGETGDTPASAPSTADRRGLGRLAHEATGEHRGA